MTNWVWMIINRGHANLVRLRYQAMTVVALTCSTRCLRHIDILGWSGWMAGLDPGITCMVVERSWINHKCLWGTFGGQTSCSLNAHTSSANRRLHPHFQEIGFAFKLILKINDVGAQLRTGRLRVQQK